MPQQSRFTNSGFAADEDDAPMAFRGGTSMCRELFDLALTSNKVRARRLRRNERHAAAAFLKPRTRTLQRCLGDTDRRQPLCRQLRVLRKWNYLQILWRCAQRQAVGSRKAKPGYRKHHCWKMRIAKGRLALRCARLRFSSHASLRRVAIPLRIARRTMRRSAPESRLE